MRLFLGPAVSAGTFALMVVLVAVRWRHIRDLRALARRDPRAYLAASDRAAARIGKYYAAASFLVMAGGIVAIVWIFATHS